MILKFKLNLKIFEKDFYLQIFYHISKIFKHL